MNLLLKIAFWLKLPQKFWGELFLRHHQKQMHKLADSIEVNVEDIILVEIVK